MKSKAAQIHFNQQGTPVADHFDDVYFSNDSGIDETQHVFINGNDLLSRWLDCHQSDFIIAETGFGTGLNCLVAMQQFATFRKQHPAHPLQHLHIVTTEKYPLNKTDIATALAVFPELQATTSALLDQYPLALNGCHRLHFPQWDTTLDLWIGDVHQLLPTWQCPQDGLIDAWFLDGFAPSKNPDMWTSTLFAQMAILTKLGGTFATFTAAGIVKRGLKEAGFTITKRNGFGRKRDMLTGKLTQIPTRRHDAPWYYPYPAKPLEGNARIAIIGGGLAGACAAWALTRRGYHVTLLTQESTLADGASGNRQGGLYPQLHADASYGSQLQAHCFLYAHPLYRELLSNAPDMAGDFCGVLQLAFNDNVSQRQEAMLQNELWPKALIQGVDAQQASELAGVTLPYRAGWIPLGGWLAPGDIVRHLCQQAISTGKLSIIYDCHVTEIDDHKHRVRVLTKTDQSFTFEHVVIATGHHSGALPATEGLPLRCVRGQVEAVPSQPPLAKLKTVLCHKGYLTPQWQSRHALGSTYTKNDVQCDVRASETEQNLTTHAKAMAASDWWHNIEHDGNARASIRLSTADHQPVTGLLSSFTSLVERYKYSQLGQGKLSPINIHSQNISILSGLGSRGLTTAPLMAELLASLLRHQPLPLADYLVNAVNPDRFALRQCLKGQHSDS